MFKIKEWFIFVTIIVTHDWKQILIEYWKSMSKSGECLTSYRSGHGILPSYYIKLRPHPTSLSVICYGNQIINETSGSLSNITTYMNITIISVTETFFSLKYDLLCANTLYRCSILMLHCRRTQNRMSGCLWGGRIDAVMRSSVIWLLFLLNTRISIKSASPLSVAAHKHSYAQWLDEYKW